MVLVSFLSNILSVVFIAFEIIDYACGSVEVAACPNVEGDFM